MRTLLAAVVVAAGLCACGEGLEGAPPVLGTAQQAATAAPADELAPPDERTPQLLSMEELFPNEEAEVKDPQNPGFADTYLWAVPTPPCRETPLTWRGMGPPGR